MELGDRDERIDAQPPVAKNDVAADKPVMNDLRQMEALSKFLFLVDLLFMPFSFRCGV